MLLVPQILTTVFSPHADIAHLLDMNQQATLKTFSYDF